jgi:type 1 glutamine amidotransferase
MPVAWTKKWGSCRVYYNARGHTPDIINSGTALEMVHRGFLWAARD